MLQPGRRASFLLGLRTVVFSPKQANALLHFSWTHPLGFGGWQGSFAFFQPTSTGHFCTGQCRMGQLIGLTSMDFATALEFSIGVLESDFASCSLIAQQAEYTCGTIALHHVCLALGLPGHFTEKHILQRHLSLGRPHQSGRHSSRTGRPPTRTWSAIRSIT